MEHVAAYDTTMRDGAQQEGISLSVYDKLQLLPILDKLGVDYIEGGWPGAIPKDTEFFQAARKIQLTNAKLVAFGSTRKAGINVSADPQIQALLDSRAPVITVVAKSDIRHVEKALHTTPAENLAMVQDTVRYLREQAEVMVDLEHYFDGIDFDSDYGIQVAITAGKAGASTVICCDTNGGGLPHEISEKISRLRSELDRVGLVDVKIGMHAHNDTGCAVANTLAAVLAGAVHIQGTVNGYGERTGNANLITCIADLQLKMGYRVVPSEALTQLTSISHNIAEIVNLAPSPREPYVGASAFAHKAGLHASAIRVDPDLYQHLQPEVVGNSMRMLVSEMSGRASIELKAAELKIDLGVDPEITKRIVTQVKERESQGYTYDAADASFALLLLDELGKKPRYWRMESWKASTCEISSAHTEDGSAFSECEATVKLWINKRHVHTGEGVGPVNALDAAFRAALQDAYPMVSNFHLSNFKVRILDEEQGGTEATIRTLVEMTYENQHWTTVGVGTNIIETSYEALVEGYQYGLMLAGVQPL